MFKRKHLILVAIVVAGFVAFCLFYLTVPTMLWYVNHTPEPDNDFGYGPLIVNFMVFVFALLLSWLTYSSYKKYNQMK